jgi:hypothetical protein
MHRVYNSAFMHLLRDEDNAKYRWLMKQTLEFDPEILKRYVNFQNNPDERTAVDQFGKGDKYFGICTVMLTLPGLPMLGHGQIEGFAEKYGMEYQRAYWDEKPDQYLIERHEREIFPLAHKRYLFAGVEHFLLYDFFSLDGGVVEDVYAYSNRYGGERALVIYHHTVADVRGWVRMSAAFSVRTGNGDERQLAQRSLGEGLDLSSSHDVFYIFRDHVTGLEYLRSGKELVEQGLYVELGAYKCHVFLDFREVRSDAVHQYGNLAGFLAGRGVPSIEEALKELFLQPLHQAFKELLNADLLGRLIGAVGDGSQVDTSEGSHVDTLESSNVDTSPDKDGDDNVQTFKRSNVQPLLDEVEAKTANLLREIKRFTECTGDEAPIAREVRDDVATILRLPQLETRFGIEPLIALADNNATWGSLFGWAFVHALGKVGDTPDYAGQSRSWIDEWRLSRIVSGALRDLGADDYAAEQAAMVLKHLTTYQDWFATPESRQPQALIDMLLGDIEIQQLLRVNRYQGVLWFDKGAFEQLLAWLLRVALIAISASGKRAPAEAEALIAECVAITEQLREAAAASGYQVEKLRELVQV